MSTTKVNEHDIVEDAFASWCTIAVDGADGAVTRDERVAVVANKVEMLPWIPGGVYDPKTGRTRAPTDAERDELNKAARASQERWKKAQKKRKKQKKQTKKQTAAETSAAGALISRL